MFYTIVRGIVIFASSQAELARKAQAIREEA